MTDERTVAALLGALATRDRPAVEATLAGEVTLRALLPRRSVEATGRAEVAATLLGFFTDVPEIAPLHSGVDAVGDVWHAALRFALHGLARESVVEQHLYCVLAGGAITTIRLLCSGFRPAAGTATPSAVRSLDALGHGCATLTPRIAAELRGLAPGEVLAVLADDPSAPDGIAAWSRLTGHQLVATTAETTGTRYYLRRHP